MKFGIGGQFPLGQQSNYVLDKWSDLELKSIDRLVEKSAEAILTFCHMGIDETMKKFN